MSAVAGAGEGGVSGGGWRLVGESHLLLPLITFQGQLATPLEQ